jgi:hypothetical protein
VVVLIPGHFGGDLGIVISHGPRQIAAVGFGDESGIQGTDGAEPQRMLNGSRALHG